MTERGDEQPDPPADSPTASSADPQTDLERTVDRLDAKAAEEHGSHTRARETPKGGSPDEPPD